MFPSCRKVTAYVRKYKASLQKEPKRTEGDYYGMYTFAKIKQPINIMIVLHYDKYQKNGKARQMIAIR